MSDPRCRPWQRPPQFQHGHHDNAFGDAEATGALLARLAATRDLEHRLASSVWQRPRSGPRVGIPFGATGNQDAAVAYLALLDRLLEDRVVTAAEVGRLREFATDWGIGVLEAECLQRGYVARAWERACADGTVTPAELRDVEILAELLGVPVEVRHRGARGGAGAPWVAVGPGSSSAPVRPREAIAQGAAAGRRDSATVRPSRPPERR